VKPCPGEGTGGFPEHSTEVLQRGGAQARLTVKEGLIGSSRFGKSWQQRVGVLVSIK